MISRPLVALLLAFSAIAAGCVNAPAPENVEAAAADASLVPAGMPTTDEIAGDILLSAATPVRSVNYGGVFVNPIELEANHTGFVFEVEWTPASPASESLSIWVRATGVGAIPPADPIEFVMTSPPLAQADGASPLRIAMPFDAFPEPGEYDVLVRASAAPVGVAANQPFTLYVTSFADMPFDDAYTALGDGHEH